MIKNRKQDVKVGIFILIGLLLICGGLLLVSGSGNFLQGKTHYKILLPQVEGLSIGSLVKMAGFRVGQISEMEIRENGNVEVKISISKKFADHVKQDSLAQLGTQGVLGDKYVNLTVGTPEAPVAADGASLQAEPAKDLKDYLNKGDIFLERLNSSMASLDSILASFQKEGRSEIVAKGFAHTSAQLSAAVKDLPKAANELQESTKHLRNVMAKIDRGEGTIGALVNDPSLYEDLKSLLGGANRNKVLKYFIQKSVEESRESRAATPPAIKK